MFAFEVIVLISVAIWLSMFAFIMETSNFRSMFFFRLMPSALAICTVILALMKLGFVIAV